MIYLKINGACGNQFFQYAFARMVQEKTGGELIIDYQYVRRNSILWAGSDNLLKDFNVVPYQYLSRPKNPKLVCILAINLIKRLFRLHNFEKRTYHFYLWLARHLERFGIYYFDTAFYPFHFYRNKNIIIRGYFESPRYFEEIDEKICKELMPKHPLLEQNIELYKVITGKPSVCITIRRLNVENPDLHDVYQYEMDYFYHAMDYIREREPKAVWIVFSDSIEWCKENFQPVGEVYYETPDNPIWEKIRLMSSCKHFIIHNSTFSWWAQHLSQNPDKILVAPAKWMQRDDQPIDIYEDNWIYMTNNGEEKSYHD